MENSDDIEKLLNELNEMQKQFDNLASKTIKQENSKKIKELNSVSSNDDIFKIISPPKKEDPLSENEDALFTLDIEYEEENNIKKKQSSKIDSENKTLDRIKIGKVNKANNDNLENKIKSKAKVITEKANDSQEQIVNKTSKVLDKEEIPSKSYLSIKEKLDRIKKEIATQESLIKDNTPKKNIISKPQSIKENKDSTNSIDITKKKEEEKITKKNALTPTKHTEINKQKKELKKPSKKNALTPIKHIEINKQKKELKKSNILIKKKEKEGNYVDVLTIIILILVIILLGLAWFLLK